MVIPKNGQKENELVKCIKETRRKKEKEDGRCNQRQKNGYMKLKTERKKPNLGFRSPTKLNYPRLLIIITPSADS